ncbi:glycosyltransferase family 2 protein [bacterium]|nr:MAG: glycosyltransferase family 2 protein [bacterium]
MKPFLSVIIPAYNESQRLPLTLVDIDKKLSEAEYSYEILVVNDGSKDGTADVVNRFSHIIKNLKLIDNKENHGKGWVVREGMLKAAGNYRLFTDSDNSTSIDHFDKMLPLFKEGYEVVIGSRAVKGARQEPPEPFYKQILGKGGNLIIQLLVVPGIWDTQCGFKCFTEEAAVRIFSVVRINRWGFDVEAIALARLFGFKVKEIPVRWVNDFRSKVGIKGYFSTLWDVVRIRFWLSRGVYPHT